jgi:hypothetical protein
MIQLTPEEGDKYRDCPVVLNFDTGFYVFPVRADMKTHSRRLIACFLSQMQTTF